MRNLILFFTIFLLTSCANEVVTTNIQKENKLNIEESVENEKPLSEFKMFMDNIRWESGMISMTRPYDHIFEVESTKYQLWYKKDTKTITLVPSELSDNRWVTFSPSDSEILIDFLNNIYGITIK